MAERSSSSSGSSHYHYYGSSGSSDNDSNSTQEDSRQPANMFRNDGSFMEMFKKMQEQQNSQESSKTDEITKTESDASSASRIQETEENVTKEHTQLPSSKKPVMSLVGKRRGGRVLTTGMVKKQRKGPEHSKPKPEGGKTDAWSEYMNEVRKYREQSCEEEGKRRPLVK